MLTQREVRADHVLSYLILQFITQLVAAGKSQIDIAVLELRGDRRVFELKRIDSVQSIIKFLYRKMLFRRLKGFLLRDFKFSGFQ